MYYLPKQEIYDGIADCCLEGFDKNLSLRDILELAWETIGDFPMHCPEHHYLMAGSLLAVYSRLNGDDRNKLVNWLREAQNRAKNVLGGFCGFYGACGAAVGAGIFLSIFKSVTPLVKENWQETTGITAACLQQISDLGGPRCCKRVCYTTARAVAAYMAEHYRLIAEMPEDINCLRYEKNSECIKEDCPYYRQ